MKSSRLNPGLDLTEVGFGATQIGNLYRATTDEEAAEAVSAAWDAGIRYFDTAPHYVATDEQQSRPTVQGLFQDVAYPLRLDVPSDQIGVSQNTHPVSAFANPSGTSPTSAD
jgi:predicted aldo/keto reductase-like oxidoreductase